MCIPLWLLGNGSVNTFPWKRRIVGIVSYAVRVVLKKSKLLVLPRAPRVEAGKNTSAVIPASRKTRWKGNPAVSDETVMHGYEFNAAVTTDRLH
jgi:hypothetical protein